MLVEEEHCRRCCCCCYYHSSSCCWLMVLLFDFCGCSWKSAAACFFSCLCYFYDPFCAGCVCAPIYQLAVQLGFKNSAHHHVREKKRGHCPMDNTANPWSKPCLCMRKHRNCVLKFVKCVRGTVQLYLDFVATLKGYSKTVSNFFNLRSGHNEGSSIATNLIRRAISSPWWASRHYCHPS